MSKNKDHCLNCGCTDDEKLLVTLSFNGTQHFICPQCLPVLIHHPDQLADKLPKKT